MRLGERFSNFANKVKSFGQRVGSTLSHIAPKVIKVGSFVSGALSHVPGVIGTAAGWIHKGLDTANRIIEALPNSGFKNKLKDLSGKANDAVNTIQPKVEEYGQRAKEYGDAGNKIINIIKPPTTGTTPKIL